MRLMFNLVYARKLLGRVITPNPKNTISRVKLV